jgi:hypothetical protein
MRASNSSRILVSCSAVAGHRFGFPIDALDPIQSSVNPEHFKTSSLPQNVFHNCGTWAIHNFSRLRFFA